MGLPTTWLSGQARTLKSTKSGSHPVRYTGQKEALKQRQNCYGFDFWMVHKISSGICLHFNYIPSFAHDLGMHTFSWNRSRMTTILHDLLISLMLIGHLLLLTLSSQLHSGRQWVCSKRVNGQSLLSLYQLRTCISGHLGCWAIHSMVGVTLFLKQFASFYVPGCPFMSLCGITMVTKRCADDLLFMELCVHGSPP